MHSEVLCRTPKLQEVSRIREPPREPQDHRVLTHIKAQIKINVKQQSETKRQTLRHSRRRGAARRYIPLNNLLRHSFCSKIFPSEAEIMIQIFRLLYRWFTECNSKSSVWPTNNAPNALAASYA